MDINFTQGQTSDQFNTPGMIAKDNPKPHVASMAGVIMTFNNFDSIMQNNLSVSDGALTFSL
jgi:hypothetical protein